jgi:hypothetical protein
MKVASRLSNFLTPSCQQTQGQPTKAIPPKAKEAKLNSSGGSTSYIAKQGGEDKCWRCGGPHKKKDYPNPAHATIPTLILTSHVPIIMHMGMMSIVAYTSPRIMTRPIIEHQC